MQYTNYRNIKKLGLLIIAFEGTEHLYNIISELRESVDYVSIGLQRLSYHGDKISEIDLQEILRLRDEDKLVDNIVEIELDTSKPAREQETDKRNMLIQDAEDHGCTHAIVIDSDEYYTKKAFENACKMIDDNDYPITYCQYINYYHDYRHFLVYPFKDGMYVPFVTRVQYRHSFECTDFLLPSDPTRRFVRPYSGVEKVVGKDGKIHKIKNYTVDYHVFKWNEVKMHHLSWLRADIRKKLEMWSSKKCFDNYDDLIDRAVDSFNKFDENCTQAKALMLFNTPGNSVDVKSFPKQYIHPKVDYRTRLRKVRNPKKLLVLSMCSTVDPIYNKLEETCVKTWKNTYLNNENTLLNESNWNQYHSSNEPYIDIDFWVYTDAEEGEDTHADKANKIIYIKREYKDKDDALYHTYSKTIFALREIKKLELKYDYLIRTNNSTWINLPLLNEFLAYQEDDSQLFTGRIYGSFWSAFNIYAGGELMVFSRRNVDILDKLSGDDPIKFEKAILGCDDNLIFGLWNKRLMKLGLRESDYIHSFEDDLFISPENHKDYDFAHIAIQTRTYFDKKNNQRDNKSDILKEYSHSENREYYDIEKMKDIQKAWNNNNESLKTLYNRMIEKYYDKFIHPIKYSKQDWFKLDDKTKTYCKLETTMDREEGLEYLRKRQKECGYVTTLI